jgi:hypothetical protein
MPTKARRSVSAPAASAPQTAANKATNTASTTRATFTQEFNPDYTHVVHDLRQIAFMAGSFLVILVALSFFLR